MCLLNIVSVTENTSQLSNYCVELINSPPCGKKNWYPSGRHFSVSAATVSHLHQSRHNITQIRVMFQNAPANPHIFLEKRVPPPWRVDTETDP